MTSGSVIMNLARLLVLGVAVIAGLLAAVLVGGRGSDAPQAPVAETKTVEGAEVLVANKEIPMGGVIAASDLSWQAWPADGVGQFISRGSSPNALEETTGAIARQPFVSGEPIRAQKIVKADGSGFMSAILSSGMRAIATEISAETGAGGFILPNDRVDVILTRRADQAGGQENFTSRTILTNVRVLAIDQTVADRDGQKVVVGRTATLELLPEQAEELALSRQRGTISLALRALADSAEKNEDKRRTEGMTIVRFGVSTNVSER
jgi:pilus assembly protein CpaB